MTSCEMLIRRSWSSRDFPSIILQQGGHALWSASQLRACAEQGEALKKVAAAACRFWNLRATRRGAFEEYYPWEQGYPPLAFSTLAAIKLAAEGAIAPAEVHAGAAVASGQLQDRFESQAANQQIAGLAALAWVRKLWPELVSDAQFESIVNRSLALQHAEGWFEEYGGPDLGYLSVTIDCLWDLFDATGDKRFVDSLYRAVEYIGLLSSATAGGSIGMHNSRNTDYLVPYGLVRAAAERPGHVGLIQRLFSNADNPAHFFAAVDDRYVGHYVGQSLFRAVRLLERLPLASPVAVKEPAAIERLLQSGHFLSVKPGGENLLVTLRKGGVVSGRAGGNSFCDFGWIVEDAGQFISHWWSSDWQYGREKNRLWVEGPLFEHQEVATTPGHHLALRLFSFLFGRRLIAGLKTKLIFEKRQSAIRFRRIVDSNAGAVRIADTFTNVSAAAKFLPAPRSSKRHVASADSFHLEDLQPARGYDVARQFNPSPGAMEIVTVYTRTGGPA